MCVHDFQRTGKGAHIKVGIRFLDMRVRQSVQSLGRAGAASETGSIRSINAQVEA